MLRAQAGNVEIAAMMKWQFAQRAANKLILTKEVVYFDKGNSEFY